ncbi:hypothetical protein QWY85_11225 [Neolewinella lacunae]|uniref:Uncharacterized protein n=1 Tax=Neolewinella lacunae TaxID=1517758 RepID=A0A923PKW3_9BACT|nr:hypothetical protein [Neolewinella lacunae]MBC6995925.1 hypothetical protein [Neolewinella lacunae]MDN3635232.1 hypothetical protein [Neolewinella lacunae]
MKNSIFIILITCMFSCETENERDFAAIDFDFNIHDNDYIFCNTVHTPLALRITNIFPYSVGIIKYSEKESSCLDHLSMVNYQVNEKEEIFGFSRGVGSFFSPPTVDTLTVGESRIYLLDSFGIYNRLSTDIEVDFSQYYYAYKNLATGSEESFSIVVYLSPERIPKQSFLEIKDGATVPFKVYQTTNE